MNNDYFFAGFIYLDDLMPDVSATNMIDISKIPNLTLLYKNYL